MKKALVIVFLFTSCLMLQAQDAVNFEFSGGIENTHLKTTMEQQVSNLMTAINRAETYNASINYSGINIDDFASESINNMWRYVRMRTSDNDIKGICLRVNSSRGTLIGYQVRNIAVRMATVKDGFDNQEICIDFDRNGKITDFNLTLGSNQYMKIIEDGKRLADLDKRLLIVHWLEQLRSAFYKKDICFIENAFSDDALIINDMLTRRVANEGLLVYNQQIDKQKYMENLRKVFTRNVNVNAQFEDVEILQHGVNTNVYGVTVSIHWNSSGYSDTGWLFLIWDFTNEDYQVILYRTWQDKRDYTREQVITLDDFDGLTDE